MFPKDAIRNHHKHDGLKQQIYFHSSGGWASSQVAGGAALPAALGRVLPAPGLLSHRSLLLPSHSRSSVSMSPSNTEFGGPGYPGRSQGLYILYKPYFQIRSHSWVLGGGHIFLGGHHSTHYSWGIVLDKKETERYNN